MSVDKPIKINVKRVKEAIETLKEANETFELRKTNSTTTLIYGNVHYKENSGTAIKQNELFFIQKVLKYVSENTSGVVVDRNKIKYTKHGILKNGYKYKKDIYEIDLNAAYWEFAYKKRYISKEIYLQGKKVSKVCRLVSLGNLAKCTTCFTYNGREYEYEGQIKSESTEGVFFDVSKETDEIMQMLRIIADNEFYFYWVDAIFFKGAETKERIENYLNSINVPYKIKLIDSIFKTGSNIVVKDKKGVRNFNFKR